MILTVNACSDLALARTLSLLHTAFLILCIIVPIVLIVSACFSLFKLVMNPDEKKGIQKILMKFLSAIILFFVPTLLGVISNFAALAINDDENVLFHIATCWDYAEVSLDEIEDAIYDEGAGTEKGSGLAVFFGGDLSGLKEYTGSSVAGAGAEKLLNIAIKEIGTSETGVNRVKYNDWYYGSPVSGNDYPWCAVFVSWCANQAGYLNKIIPKYASCAAGVAWFRSKGQFHLNSVDYTPQPGDIVFFGSSGGSHTGIVEKADKDNIYTVEGNTSNTVARRTHSRHDRYIYGYGSPAYEEGD